jgi:DNA adenine methylase
MKPIIKWVGGKTQMLNELKQIITPELLDGHTYYEVFAGGAALAFDLQHPQTVINDLNSELINMYTVIRDEPEYLLADLRIHQRRHSDEYYYMIRNLDRADSVYSQLSSVAKAARTIYLNKTCFNGLYRVNSKGYFNSPIGRTSCGKTPDIVQEELIREMSEYLKTVQFYNTDFHNVTMNAKPGDVFFFDPPYDTDEDIKSDGFVGYQKEGWKRSDLVRLKAVCDRLVKEGCKVILTNNDTEYVRELFKDYSIKEVEVKRSINRDGNNRKGREVIIYKI